MKKTPFTIDAVITWVDGDDSSHKSKIKHYAKGENIKLNEFFRTQYRQINEIEFVVKSILKYAKFIRTIFIVTDNQVPNFLKESKSIEKYSNVKIIDHTAIFKGYEEFLPTFNSQTIETLLYKIPNLSEHFIYFNDDTFLINETKESDFFINGFPVLRGKWVKYNENIFHKRIFTTKKKKEKVTHKKAKEKSAKLLDFKQNYNFYHTPHPIRKSTFESYYKENKEVLMLNLKYKFRHINQYIPQSLMNHVEIKNKTSVFEKNISLTYFQSYNFFKVKFKLKAIDNHNNLFMCLQNLEKANKKSLKYIFNWLHKRYL